MTDPEGDGDRLLAGVRVLDLSRVMSGPYCTAMLADLGAEVIKIEMPGGGDDSRHFGPFVDGESAYFWLLNRGKKSLSVNLKSERGRAIVEALVKSSDVVIENFRPGVADRLGVGYDSLREINPSLIYASISGFGQTGPLADRPAYDLVVQAMSGLMDVTGQRNGPPTAIGESMADVCAGMFTAWGISTALFDRERTGKGRHLDIAMLDSMFSMMLTVLGLQLYSDRAPKRVGSRHPVTYPVDAYKTLDGYVVMVVTTDRGFAALGKAMGQPSLSTDERFRTNADRNAHEDALRAIIEDWTSVHATADAIEALDGVGIPAAPVMSLGEIASSDHITSRGMISNVTHPTHGEISVVPQPVQFSGARRDPAEPPPTLGEHTHEILRELLQLGETEIQSLANDNVI